MMEFELRRPFPIVERTCMRSDFRVLSTRRAGCGGKKASPIACRLAALAIAFCQLCRAGVAQEALPNTQLLTLGGDLSALMVAGIDKFLTAETQRSLEERQKLWQRDFSSRAAYETSIGGH